MSGTYGIMVRPARMDELIPSGIQEPEDGLFSIIESQNEAAFREGSVVAGNQFNSLEVTEGDFEGKIVLNCTLSSVELDSAGFSGLIIVNGQYNNLEFNVSGFGGTVVINGELNNLELAGTISALSSGEVGGPNLESVLLEGLKFSSAGFDEDSFAGEIEFVDCDFSGSVFEKVDFSTLTFTNCNLIGANFTDSNPEAGTYNGGQVPPEILNPPV